MSRRIYEAESIARDIRRTFTAKEEMKKHNFTFNWPRKWQNVGDSLAIAYSSDKWKDEGDCELYKHLSEATQFAYCIPGFLRDYENPAKAWPTIGPSVDMSEIPMPREFAILALFEEIDLRLHTGGTDDEPRFGKKNEGIVKVTVAHGYLGASKIMWSEVEDRDDEPFLFVYTKKDGPLIVVLGEELDILADGIVG